MSTQSVRSENLIFGAFIVVLLAAGAALGYALAGYAKLLPYKLVNIIGITYGLIGIVVLAEFVTTSESLKKFMVHWVAGILIWAHSVIPLGALIGIGIGHALPSAAITAKFFVSFFAYSMGVLVVVESVVVFPKAKRLQALSSRTQTFGLILLITGVVLQLIAAIEDFNA